MEIITAILEYIEDELSRMYWNKNQKDIESPFRNTGNEYRNDTFSVRAYSWMDDDDAPNFEYRGFKVWWYKRVGRGMVWECDRVITLEYLDRMLADCIKSMEKDFCEKSE